MCMRVSRCTQPRKQVHGDQGSRGVKGGGGRTTHAPLMRGADTPCSALDTMTTPNRSSTFGPSPKKQSNTRTTS